LLKIQQNNDNIKTKYINIILKNWLYYILTHIIDCNRKKINVMIEAFNRVMLRISCIITGPVTRPRSVAREFFASPHFPECWGCRLERGRRRRSDSECKEESPLSRRRHGMPSLEETPLSSSGDYGSGTRRASWNAPAPMAVPFPRDARSVGSDIVRGWSACNWLFATTNDHVGTRTRLKRGRRVDEDFPVLRVDSIFHSSLPSAWQEKT